jgi:glycosyltransferase involved in cell wall biosynthesis
MNISVVLSTYNRCNILHRALQCLEAQHAHGVEYEVVVVDNNSADHTKDVIERFAARDNRVRYLFEQRQGLSYARNTGIRAAHADAIAFTDDDVEVAPDWIYQIHRTLSRYPDADFIGGRVLPVSNQPMPAWAHAKLAPFALQDFGDRAVVVSADDPRCLIGACLVVRRRAIERAGLFNIETQRVKNGVGSTEDADWETQVWNYGGHGIYVPEIVVRSEIAAERFTKRYHRKWHAGHGKFYARARHPELETARRLLDVPAYLYRQVIQSGFESVTLSLQRRETEAFERQSRLMFCIGFMAERWRAQLISRPPRTQTAPVNSLAG